MTEQVGELSAVDVIETMESGHEFTVEGDPRFGDRVPVVKFLEALGDWVDALRLTGRQVLPKRRPTVEWLLTEVNPGSAVARLDPFPTTTDGPFVAAQSVQRNVRALRAIQAGEDTNPFVGQLALKPLTKLVHAVDRGELPPIRIVRGPLFAEIAPRDDSDADRSRLFPALGSIEGVLTGVSFAANPASFVVRDRLDKILVTCYFDPDRFYDDVVQNLRRRVSISGRVTRRSNGIPVFVTDVQEIHRFPDRSELPQPIDIIGIDPDFAGGDPAEVYIGGRRERYP